MILPENCSKQRVHRSFDRSGRIPFQFSTDTCMFDGTGVSEYPRTALEYTIRTPSSDGQHISFWSVLSVFLSGAQRLKHALGFLRRASTGRAFWCVSFPQTRSYPIVPRVVSGQRMPLVAHTARADFCIRHKAQGTASVCADFNPTYLFCQRKTSHVQ